MLGERKLICNPDGLQDWQFFSGESYLNRRASLETAETPGDESFSDRLWPYLKPERVRDNKEQRIGGRPVEIRQQASLLGHSQEDAARRVPA